MRGRWWWLAGIAAPRSLRSYPPPPGGAAQPPPERRTLRFLAIPYLGIHSYQNQEASAYDPGARVGALIGARGDVLSFNVEVTVDFSNIHRSASGFSYQEHAYDIAFSPLFLASAGRLELAIGPKVGVFMIDTTVKDAGGSYGYSASGYVAGVNGGVFMPLSPRASLGILLSFKRMWMSGGCAHRACGAGATSAAPATGRCAALRRSSSALRDSPSGSCRAASPAA